MSHTYDKHFLTTPTRWMDNDIYGHVNSVVYYSWFDSVINEDLIRVGGLDIHNAPVVGFAVNSGCNYKKSFSFQEPVQAGLCVSKFGNRSVRYEVGLFGKGDDEPRATGFFVHVFVDRIAGKSVAIPAAIRIALQDITAPLPPLDNTCPPHLHRPTPTRRLQRA